MIDLEDLKKKAQAATPGERKVFHNGDHSSCLCYQKALLTGFVVFDSCADQEFIAATNPAVVLELIEKLEIVREALETIGNAIVLPGDVAVISLRDIAREALGRIAPTECNEGKKTK